MMHEFNPRLFPNYCTMIYTRNPATYSAEKKSHTNSWRIVRLEGGYISSPLYMHCEKVCWNWPVWVVHIFFTTGDYNTSLALWFTCDMIYYQLFGVYLQRSYELPSEIELQMNGLLCWKTTYLSFMYIPAGK